MKKQNIKQNNTPPSPALIRQLNLMGFIISQDCVIVKVPTKESKEKCLKVLIYYRILLIVKKFLFFKKVFVF